MSGCASCGSSCASCTSHPYCTRLHTRPPPPAHRTRQVRFKPQPYNRMMGVDSANELVLRVQPDEVTPFDMERKAHWMGGWMQPRRGSEAEARRPCFCAPATHPPTPPSLQALYMVAVAKTPGIAAGVGPEERRTPIAMGLRYATQFGDGSPFKSGDAYERMCPPEPPLPQASVPDYGCTPSARIIHACTMHPAPCTMHHAPCTMHHAPCTVHHAPCTMHHAPCTMHRAPCTVHHAPCTMHHAPCTVHRAPCTMHHAPCTMHAPLCRALTRIQAAQRGARRSGAASPHCLIATDHGLL